MWKRLLVWAISLCLGLFALQDGYLILGVGMLGVSVVSVFLWILKIFREWSGSEKCINIPRREIVVFVIVSNAFVLANYFRVPWLGFGVVAIVVILSFFIFLMKSNKEGRK